MGNYHVRFWNGGGAGDRSTDRSAADAAAPRDYWRSGVVGLIMGQATRPSPAAPLKRTVRQQLPLCSRDKEEPKWRKQECMGSLDSLYGGGHPNESG